MAKLPTFDNIEVIGALAAVAAVGYVLYKGYGLAGKAGSAIVNTATTTLNPASDKNIIYSNLPDSVTTKVGDFLGSIFGPPMPKFELNPTAPAKSFVVDGASLDSMGKLVVDTTPAQQLTDNVDNMQNFINQLTLTGGA